MPKKRLTLEEVKVFVLMALVAIAMMASTVIAFAIGSGRG